jgi:hypothetical protein
MERKFRLHLVVQQSAEVIHPVWDGVAQLQSGENSNAFGHLGETGSELKLTLFPKKSS